MPESTCQRLHTRSERGAEFLHIVIAGCGRVGASLAEMLSYEGHDVVIIDRDIRSFARLGRTFNGVTIEGIAFDEEVLKEAGIEYADVFAAVTNFDSTNLMASEIAKSVFEVPKVISRLYNPDKELTFYKMGIDYICGTTLMTSRIREKLFQEEDLIIHEDLPSVGLQVIEVTLPAKVKGKKASDLNLGISSRLIMLLRNGAVIDPATNPELQQNDKAIMLMRKDGWPYLLECLSDTQSAKCELLLKGGPLPAENTLNEEIKIIIGGCSQVGAHLGYLLSLEGYDVTIIDENPDLFRRLPPRYEGRCIEGVVFEEDVLIEAGIKEASAFVSVTKFDNKNLMAAEVARHIFKVPHVMARLFNPDKERTYQALNLNYVCGTRLLKQALIEFILEPDVRVRTSCLNNMFDLVEFECPELWDRADVSSIRKKIGLHFAYILRRGSGYMPNDGFVLRKGDHITALVSQTSLNKLEKHIKKSKG